MNFSNSRKSYFTDHISPPDRVSERVPECGGFSCYFTMNWSNYKTFLENTQENLSLHLNEKMRFQLSSSFKAKINNMTRRRGIISLKQVVDFCLESAGSNLDSSIRGLSRNEEQISWTSQHLANFPVSGPFSTHFP